MNIGSVSASNSNVQKIGTVAFSIAKEAARFSKKVRIYVSIYICISIYIYIFYFIDFVILKILYIIVH